MEHLRGHGVARELHLESLIHLDPFNQSQASSNRLNQISSTEVHRRESLARRRWRPLLELGSSQGEVPRLLVHLRRRNRARVIRIEPIPSATVHRILRRFSQLRPPRTKFASSATPS
jgi:hypothetical protein